MFAIDQSITAPGLREKNLVKVFFSMNNHEVATPEMMLEEARSYVMFCGEADGKVSAYIGLYLLQTGRRLFYAHSSNPFSPGEMGSVEDEALCFVEGLGALVDEIDIAKLSAEAKGRWIDDQDIFSLEEHPERPPEAPVPPPAEAETVKEELQAAAQPYAPAPAEVPQPQTPIVETVEPVQQPAPAQQIQPASQATPVPPVIEIPPTPQMPPLQADQLPPTASTAPLTQLPSAEEPSSAPENEATSQPAADAEIEDEAQAVPSPADIAETWDEPRQRPASPGAAPADAAFPAPDRARQKPSARAAGSKPASSAAPSTGRQDIRQKTTKDDSGRPPKPSMKRRTEDNTGVVRRDREALARLLSSF